MVDLVEPDKSDALQEVGEGERAFDIAVRWLRPKFNDALAPDPETPTR